MNTFFKLYLEAWLLFASRPRSSSSGRRERRGAIDRWAWPARARRRRSSSLAALFTTVTAGARRVSRHFAPYDGPVARRPALPRDAPPGRVPRGRLAAPHGRRARPSCSRRRARPTRTSAASRCSRACRRCSAGTTTSSSAATPRPRSRRAGAPSRRSTRTRSVARVEALLQALPRRLRLRRLARAQDLSGGRASRSSTDRKALFQLAYENPEAQIYRVVGRTRAGRARCPRRRRCPRPRPPRAAARTSPRRRPRSWRSRRAASPPSRTARAARRGRRRPRPALGRRLRPLAPAGLRRRRRLPRRLGRPRRRQVRLRELCGVAIARRRALRRRHVERPRPGLHPRRRVAARHGGELYGPRGVAVAPDGTVWVTDTGNHRVVPYDAELQERAASSARRARARASSRVPSASRPARPGRSTSATPATAASRSSIPGDVSCATSPSPGWKEAVRAAPRGRRGRHVSTSPIRRATPCSSSTRRATSARGGTPTTRATVLAAPTGIAIDRKDRILYVVNSGDSSVSKEKLAARKGRLMHFGWSPCDPFDRRGGPRSPAGKPRRRSAASPSGPRRPPPRPAAIRSHSFRAASRSTARRCIAAAHPWNGRIVMPFTPRRRLRGATASASSTARAGRRRSAPDGRVWVSSTPGQPSYVVVPVPDPLLARTRRASATRGDRAAGRVREPVGIAAAPSGVVYVADAGNKRIQVLGAARRLRCELRRPGLGTRTPSRPWPSTRTGTIYATDPGRAGRSSDRRQASSS